METIRRFFQPPLGSFFLFGPRGTGKSTWLRQTYPAALSIDLLDPESCRGFQARPERLQEIVDAALPSTPVVLDEIQKVPTLLDVVHLTLERAPQRQFILTGSSSRKLKRSGVDLLAGRAVLKTLHPFMAAELGPRFDLERNLPLGNVAFGAGRGGSRRNVAVLCRVVRARRSASRGPGAKCRGICAVFWKR